MNTSPFRVRLAVLLLACTGGVQAQIVPLSSEASLSVQGYAIVPEMWGGGRETYEMTSSATNFASFSDALSGHAFAEITILPPFELFLGTALAAASSASQTTTIGTNLITMESSASASASVYSQVGGRSASARSFTEITFQLDEAVLYSLAGSGIHYQSSWPYTFSTYIATLRSSTGTDIFRAEHQFHPDGPSQIFFELSPPQTGMLLPGIYTFRADVAAQALGDPLGESGAGSLSLALQVTRVPDAGSTALLLLVGAAGLLLYTRAVSPEQGAVGPGHRPVS